MSPDQISELGYALIFAAVAFASAAAFGISMAADVTWLRGKFSQGKRTRGQTLEARQ